MSESGSGSARIFTPPDPAERKFTADLLAARRHLGISQESVARAMREAGYGEFRQQTIFRIESGKRAIKLGEALTLAGLLGVPLGEAPVSPDMRLVLRETVVSFEQMSQSLAASAQHLRGLTAPVQVQEEHGDYGVIS